MQHLYPRLGVSSPFDPTRKLVSSPWVPPTWLAVGRLVIGSYALTTLIVTLVWECVVVGDGNSYFMYFTHLTYIGLCAYMFAAGVQTMVYAHRVRVSGGWCLHQDFGQGVREPIGGVSGSAAEGFSHLGSGDKEIGSGADSNIVHYPLQAWPRAIQFLHVWLQTTVYTFPLLVTIVYWALLASPASFSTPYNAYSNVSLHILNTGFSLLDIVISASPPPPWLLLPVCLATLAGYLGVAYIGHRVQGIYPYSFLNPETQHSRLAIYIVGIAVAYCVIFTFVRGFIVLLRFLVVHGSAGLQSGGWALWKSQRDDLAGSVERLEDWEEVEYLPSGSELSNTGKVRI